MRNYLHRLILPVILLICCLLGCRECAGTVITSAVREVADLVPFRSADEKMVVLCPDSYALDTWRPSESNVMQVAHSSLYVSLGTAVESNMLFKARMLNPQLKILDVSACCRRIPDNPYVWAATDNHDKIWKCAVEGRGLPWRGSCVVYEGIARRCARDIGDKKYTVAITHRAFEYECALSGARTLTVDVTATPEEKYPSGSELAKLKAESVNLLLMFPRNREFVDVGLLEANGIHVFETQLTSLIDLIRTEIEISKGFLAFTEGREDAYGAPSKAR